MMFNERKRRIYLAARYYDAPLMREWRARLKDHGHIVISRWIDGKTASNDYERNRFASEDVEDIKNSCTLIVRNDPNYFGSGWGGRHVEYGLAIAWEKDIFLVGGRENIFHYLDGVNYYATFENLVNSL
jgi:hypothetical protein